MGPLMGLGAERLSLGASPHPYRAHPDRSGAPMIDWGGLGLLAILIWIFFFYAIATKH